MPYARGSRAAKHKNFDCVNLAMITGILLAAGTSSRFGGNKLLHALADDTPMVVKAFQNVSKVLNEVVVVVADEYSDLARLLSAEGGGVIPCYSAALGMGASIACGVAASADSDGWVIALGDMPFLKANSVKCVVDALRSGALLVAPEYRGRRGHPVGFGGACRDDLLHLRGDVGARRLLETNADQVTRIVVDDPGILIDVDTPADIKLHENLAQNQVVAGRSRQSSL